MNTGTTSTTSRGLRLALRVYPAAYRAERGEEITAVHADLTEGAGKLATARETAGVAAYGLRVRTGLTAERHRRTPARHHRAAGRRHGARPVTARPVAPPAVLATGTAARPPAPAGTPIVDWHPVLVASVVPGVLWLLVVAAALLRRWTAARILAALAGVAAVAHVVRPASHTMAAWAPGMGRTTRTWSSRPERAWCGPCWSSPPPATCSTARSPAGRAPPSCPSCCWSPSILRGLT